MGRIPSLIFAAASSKTPPSSAISTLISPPSFFSNLISLPRVLFSSSVDFVDQLPLTEVNKMDSSSDVSFYNSNKLFINYLLKRKSVVHYCPMIQDFIQQAYQYIIDLVNKNKESGRMFLLFLVTFSVLPLLCLLQRPLSLCYHL